MLSFRTRFELDSIQIESAKLLYVILTCDRMWLRKMPN